MALKELIKNQTIIIDDHKRGNGEVRNWDDTTADVHIDEITKYKIKGKRQEVRIKIPINSDRPLKIQNKYKKNLDEIPSPLRREIHKAFENYRTRERFISDIVEIIRNFDTILESENRVRSILSKLSKHFGLVWTKEKIAVYANNVMTLYTEKFTDKEGRQYVIEVDKEKIKIGENNIFAKRHKNT